MEEFRSSKYKGANAAMEVKLCKYSKDTCTG